MGEDCIHGMDKLEVVAVADCDGPHQWVLVYSFEGEEAVVVSVDSLDNVGWALDAGEVVDGGSQVLFLLRPLVRRVLLAVVVVGWA